MGTEKSKPKGPPCVPVGNEACQVPLNGGAEGWEFSGTTEQTWSIFFSYTTSKSSDCTVRYSIISVGDVTEVDVYSQ